MLTATVVGNVWSTRRLAEIPNGAFLEVEAEGTGARLVAFDVLGSGVGERVLVAQGSVAAAWFPGKSPPIDALIIGSIDEAGGGPGGSLSRAGGGPVTKERGRRPSGGSGGSLPRASSSGAAVTAGPDRKKGKVHGG